MMTTINSRLLIEDAVYYSLCGVALWKGRWPERTVAAALLIENTASFFIQDVRHLQQPRFVSLGLDLGVLGATLFVAFSTNLRWPLLASALQILSMLTFVARIIDPTIRAWAYVTVDIAISFLSAITVAFGAVTQRRRSLGSHITGPDGP